MGLELTKQIGTSKGITKKAYIRVRNVRIDKANGVRCDVETFQSQDEAPENNPMSGLMTQQNAAVSELIGQTYFIPFFERVEGEDGVEFQEINQEYKDINIFNFVYMKLKLSLEEKLDQKLEDC